ncbi:IniB N-terminal domain-containing protein [Saccharopolyspora sp. NPDC000359]|uniref:IniB N-terminal domain-containing protein n=1 Tax=Saccharopolyspora sp. NPDC000359 TaxID=3154251 RepID=UPI00331F412A
MVSPQHGRAESTTPDPGTHSTGLPEEPTLYEFLTRLVSDPAARSAFDTDPQATLDQAGLGGMSATDVLHASSLVLDYAPVEVVTEYGRSLQSSVEKFAASSQAVAFNQLHPAHPLDQEEQSMLQNSPAQPEDFGKDNDVDATLPAPAPAPSNNTDVDVDIEQNDSHNLISIHHVLSDNAVGNDSIIGSVVGNTVGQVGDSLDLGDVTTTVGGAVTEINQTANHVFDTSVDLTAGAGSLVYGDVTNLVGNVTTGDVTNVVGDVTNVAGDLNLGNVLNNVTTGDVTEIVSNAPVVGDVTNVVSNAPVVGDVVNNVASGDITNVTGVVGDVTNVAGDLPVVGEVTGVVGDVAGNVPVVGDALGTVAGGDVHALPVDDVTAAIPAEPVEAVTDTVGSLPVVGEVADTATSALPLDLDGLL